MGLSRTYVEKQEEANPDIHIRADAFEWKADEYDALNYQLHQLPIGIAHRNAYEGITAVIPPAEKRGLILIDPPFEQEHRDFGALLICWSKRIKWSNGIFALWYPLKNTDAVELFYKKMKRTEIRRQLVLS